MPRGGARPGAGRKPKPATDKPKGHTGADGKKLPDAPAGWPFGTEPPPAPPPPPAAPPVEDDLNTETPLEFLMSVMRSPKEAMALRMQAAIQAAPYMHTKKGDVGKKEQANENAKKVASKFSAARPPTLVAAGGKKV